MIDKNKCRIKRIVCSTLEKFSDETYPHITNNGLCHTSDGQEYVFRKCVILSLRNFVGITASVRPSQVRLVEHETLSGSIGLEKASNQDVT
jgi:hypothetical protein